MNSSDCKLSNKASCNVGNFMGLPATATKVVGIMLWESSGDSSNGATLNATGQLKAAARPESYI